VQPDHGSMLRYLILIWPLSTAEHGSNEVVLEEVIGEVRRIPLPRTRMNRGAGGPSIHPTGFYSLSRKG
jgi:hypothetical protein